MKPSELIEIIKTYSKDDEKKLKATIKILCHTQEGREEHVPAMMEFHQRSGAQGDDPIFMPVRLPGLPDGHSSKGHEVTAGYVLKEIKEYSDTGAITQASEVRVCNSQTVSYGDCVNLKSKPVASYEWEKDYLLLRASE